MKAPLDGPITAEQAERAQAVIRGIIADLVAYHDSIVVGGDKLDYIAPIEKGNLGNLTGRLRGAWLVLMGAEL
jgi:hypothetical protein